MRRAIWLLMGVLLAGQPAMAERVLFEPEGTGPDAAQARNGEAWRLFSDRVMGGVTRGELSAETIDGRPCLRMHGDVSLENNGGFLQIAIDLGDAFQQQLANYRGIAIDVRG
ncbi:MAG: CIA30 family protein, partial [Halieaceae bacterium]|nr:CIA30 family protein [Halieaceae bacterium]